MTRINVLATATGGGVGMGVIKSLRLANRSEDEDYRIIGVDANPMSAGIYYSDKGYVVPLAKANNYTEKMLEICYKENIDIIISDQDELEPLSRNQQMFEKRGHKVLIASPEIIDIGLSKFLFDKWCKQNDIPYPNSSIKGKGNLKYPIVMKPEKGCASQHLYFLNTEEDYNYYKSKVAVSCIFQEELIPSDSFTGEYTVGVLTATDGEILGSIALQRKRKPPISTWEAKCGDYKDVRILAENLCKKLKIIGPCNVQMIRTKEGLKIFEINTRFSGTTIVRAVLGFNEVHAAIQNFLFNKKMKLDFKRDMWMFKYQGEIYVPSSMFGHQKREMLDSYD